MTQQLMQNGGFWSRARFSFFDILVVIGFIVFLGFFYNCEGTPLFAQKTITESEVPDFQIEFPEETKQQGKYSFLPTEMADYILSLCDELGIDPDLAISILLNENPMIDVNAINKNTNGSLDVGLWQLNDRYIYTSFKKQYWKFNKLEISPFNWKHNTYIALHHIAALNAKLKVFDDVVRAYNCGVSAVMNNRIPESSQVYLARAKITYDLLRREITPPAVKIFSGVDEAVALGGGI